MKQIITHEYWSFDTVRGMCIREDFYTRGDSYAYSEMLDFVSNSEPTPGNIYKVAKDIANHSCFADDSWSEEEKIENVAYCIVTGAIKRWCELKD